MSKSLINLDWEGLPELAQSLRDLADAVEIKQTLSEGLIDAAQPMVRMAQSLAPRKSGRMALGVKVSAELSKRQRREQHLAGGTDNSTTQTVYVGAKPVGPAVLVEFGTTHRHWKTGKSTGSTAPKPFMRPAWEATKNQILSKFSVTIWIAIAHAAERIAKRQASLIAQTGGSA